jgi:hypothetical protein
MDIQAKKLSLIEWLISLQDETAINKMYSFRKKLAHNPTKKISIDELLADLELSEKARKVGKVVSLEQIEKKSVNW